MLKEYTTKEYQELYLSLPKKMQSVFWDEELSSRVEKISERFNLSSSHQHKIVKMTVHLFLGVLPPGQVGLVINEELKLEGSLSQKITNDFVRFIIYPIQHLLREIYSEEDFKIAGIENFLKDNKDNSFYRDNYREPIE